jgi:hypothetical protein
MPRRVYGYLSDEQIIKNYRKGFPATRKLINKILKHRGTCKIPSDKCPACYYNLLTQIEKELGMRDM